MVYDIRYGNRYKEISCKYDFPSNQLSEEGVTKICEALQSGMSAQKISNEYNYSLATVTHILCGNSWTQISKNYTFPNKRIDDDIIHAICKRLEEGKSYKEIAIEFNVGKRLVEHIKLGTTHKEISSQYNIVVNQFKVSDDVIHNICKDLVSGSYFMKDIAARNNVSLSFVKDIKYRRSRTDITDQYKW